MSKDSELYKEYKQYIGQGFLTSSKSPERFIKDVYPKFIRSARGAYVKGEDDKTYMDFISSLGSVFIGYRKLKLDLVPNLSLPSKRELDLAKKLNEFFPFVKNWKFLKTGTEACQAAIRIARGYTGKDIVYTTGYHGWSDEFVSLMDPPEGAGIPRTAGHSMAHLPTDLSKISGNNNVAAVIVEPIETDASQERIDYLKRLREACTKGKVLLIFDEIITALRYRDYSVSRFHGIIPDLFIGGKALGNGVAISAIGASNRDILDNPNYFVSGTYCAELIGITAALSTLHILQKKHKDSPKQLWDKAKEFQEGFNLEAARCSYHLKLVGYPTRLVFEGENRYIFWQEACKAGLLFGPSIFFSLAHLSHMDNLLSFCQDLLRRTHESRPPLLCIPTTAFHRKNPPVRL